MWDEICFHIPKTLSSSDRYTCSLSFLNYRHRNPCNHFSNGTSTSKICLRKTSKIGRIEAYPCFVCCNWRWVFQKISNTLGSKTQPTVEASSVWDKILHAPWQLPFPVFSSMLPFILMCPARRYLNLSSYLRQEYTPCLRYALASACWMSNAYNCFAECRKLMASDWQWIVRHLACEKYRAQTCQIGAPTSKWPSDAGVPLLLELCRPLLRRRACTGPFPWGEEPALEWDRNIVFVRHQYCYLISKYQCVEMYLIKEGVGRRNSFQTLTINSATHPLH